MADPVGNKHINVFIDTNIIEEYVPWQKGSCLRCAEFPEGKDFFDLTKFARNNNLKNFTICFPEVVIKEIQNHLRDAYTNTQKSYSDILENVKRIFGQTFNEKHEFSHQNIDALNAFIMEETSRFIAKYSIRVIPHPNDIFQELLRKALAKEPPFSAVKANGKEFSDAGFKDAVLWESLLNEARKDNTLTILFSKDGDFSKAIPVDMIDKIFIYGKYQDVIDKLKAVYNLSEKDEIICRVKTDTYLWERAMEDVQITGSFDISSVNIISIDPYSDMDESDDMSGTQGYSIIASILIDNKRYCFTIIYDYSSNEILSSELSEE